MRLYVGNLSYRSSEQDVHKAFTAFGEVTRTQLAIDPETGRSAGFAYVEMPNEQEAQAAIARLNGKEISSRVVTVSLATVEEPAVRPERERFERPPRPARFARGGEQARSGGRDGAGQRGPADRRPRSQEAPRGDQGRSERPRSAHVRSEPSRGDHPRREQSRGGDRPASVWDRRRRSEPPTAQRRDSESSLREDMPKDLPKDLSSAATPLAQQPVNPPEPPPPEPPVADNPWTRRRPKSP